MPQNPFKRTINDLLQRLRGIDEGESSGSSRSRVNVAGRVNKASSVNVGGQGAHSASSRQKVRIRQDGETTYEESETTKTNL